MMHKIKLINNHISTVTLKGEKKETNKQKMEKSQSPFAFPFPQIKHNIIIQYLSIFSLNSQAKEVFQPLTKVKTCPVTYHQEEECTPNCCVTVSANNQLFFSTIPVKNQSGGDAAAFHPSANTETQVPAILRTLKD